MPPVWPFRQRVLEPAVFRVCTADDVLRRSLLFISLRWKIALPLVVVVVAVSGAGAYLITDSIARGVQDRELDHLLTSSRAVSDRLQGIGAAHQTQLVTLAQTPGLVSGILARDSLGLHPALEPLAAAGNLDLLLVYDSAGREVIGLMREVLPDGQVDYAVATDTPQPGMVSAALAGQGSARTPLSALLLTRQGYVLATAGPVIAKEQIVGVIVVGTRLDRALVLLRGGDKTDLAVFGPNSEFLGTTFALDDARLRDLRLSLERFQQSVYGRDEVPVEAFSMGDQAYNAAYLPLAINGTPLGVIAVYAEDNTIYATTLSRQMFSLITALLVGLVVLMLFGVMGIFAGRLERITETIHALAAGDGRARTGMRARDEIGELGAALDRLATQHQRHTDSLLKLLRQERSETTRLNAVLESIPDGLIVQDLDGRVLLINETARKLLGGQRAFRAARLHELTAVVTEKLGPALAPGIYALGDPTRVPLDDKMLQAQAAAILTQTNARIGTVVVLRDITADVSREQTREKLLDELASRAAVPATPHSYETLTALAREVARNTRAIQRVIAELRDLSTFEPDDLKVGQQPLLLNDLLWHVAAEWQPAAKGARIRLHVRFGPRGLYILGDERRLRWAIGNVVDNALKYSPKGSVVNLSVRVQGEAPSQADLIIEDRGYGIAPDDLPNVFTRFYRGTPHDAQGNPIRKPGTGQGLFIAWRVIEAHGGALTLSSQVGVGTTATISLPLTAPVTLEMPVESGGADDLVSSEDRLGLKQFKN